MVLLSFEEYDSKIAPFLRNGVIIDTSTLWEFIQGLVRTQRRTTDTGWKEEYNKIINLFDRIKLTGKWDRMFLTPHIMTETCSHVNIAYNKRGDFKDIGEQVMSIMDAIDEKVPIKDDCVACYECGRNLEPGDLSIYAVADGFIKDKLKVAILTKDSGFVSRYAENPYVMVIDHNLVQDLR